MPLQQEQSASRQAADQLEKQLSLQQPTAQLEEEKEVAGALRAARNRLRYGSVVTSGTWLA